MARKVSVIVNAGSGLGNDDALLERLRALFDAAGADADVRLARGGIEISAAVEAALARGPDVIVAGGGDGTVSSVASAIADKPVALGVLALGTLNHFARDAGVPADIEEAVRTIVDGHRVQVDIAEVNGRTFINNSGLGLYPDIVRNRERQRCRRASTIAATTA